MELVTVFAGMSALCFGVAISSVIAEKHDYNVGNLPDDAAAIGIGFIGVAIFGLLFI
jgi:hypothetical protein